MNKLALCTNCCRSYVLSLLMHPTKRHVMWICHLACDTNFDHLVKVVSEEFLHWRVTIFPFEVNRYLEGHVLGLCIFSHLYFPCPRLATSPRSLGSSFWRMMFRDQIANICRIVEKAREFQKNIYFCVIDYVKAFDCLDHYKLWKILKEMGIPDHLTCLLRNLNAC